MIEDDVILEVRAIREEYCRQFGYDLAAIVRDLQEQQRAEGREVIHQTIAGRIGRDGPTGHPDPSPISDSVE